MFPASCRYAQSVQLRAPCQQLAACGSFVALPDAASKSPCVLVYDRAELVANGDEAIPVRLFVHESAVTALAFSADNELIVWHSMNEVWSSHRAHRHPPAGLTLSLLALVGASVEFAYANSDDTAAANAAETEVESDESASQAAVRIVSSSVVRAPGISPVEFCCFDPSARLTAVCIECKVLIVSRETGKLSCVLDAHVARVTSCAFCWHARELFITVSEDRTYKVFNLETRTLVYQSSILSAAPNLALALDPVLPRAAIGAADGRVRLIDLASHTGGFPVLHTIDVTGAMRARETREAGAYRRRAEAATAAGAAVVITTKSKPWQNEYDAHSMRAIDAAAAAASAADRDDVNSCSDAAAEVARPVLALHFLNSGGSMSRALAGAAAPSPLIVCVSNAVALVDSASQSLNGSVVFTGCSEVLAAQLKLHPRLGSVAQIGFIGTAAVAEHSRSAGRSNGHDTIDMVLASSFVPALAVLRFNPSVAVSMASCNSEDNDGDDEDDEDDDSGITFDDGEVDSDDGDGDQEAARAQRWANISVFAREIDDWPPECPLRNSTFAEPAPASAAAKGAGKKGVVQRKPIVFNTRIKSSGYGSVPPVRTMFGRKAVGPSRPAAAAVGLEQRAYPRDCGPLVTWQKQHVLPASTPLHSAAIMRVAFAPDATRVLTASTDGTARITKIPFSRYLGDGVQLIGHTAPVRDCTFSRDAALVATASADRTVRVWRAGGETCFTISTQICQPSRAASVAVTAGAAASATAAADLVADNAPFAAECTGVRFFYQDKFVLLASGNRLSLFKYAIDVDSAERDLKRLQSRCKYRLVYAHQAQGVQSVTAFDAINAFSSSLIVCATSTRAVDVIDACVSKTVRRIADAHARPVHTVRMNAGSSYTSVSDDERHLFLTAAADSCIKLWDLRVAACVRRFEGHTNRQQGVGVSFSPCMRWIAAGSEDKAAHLFDIGTGAPFAKCVGHTDVVSDVAFSPLHPQLVTSCFDKQLRFFSDAK